MTFFQYIISYQIVYRCVNQLLLPCSLLLHTIAMFNPLKGSIYRIQFQTCTRDNINLSQLNKIMMCTSKNDGHQLLTKLELCIGVVAIGSEAEWLCRAIMYSIFRV